MIIRDSHSESGHDELNAFTLVSPDRKWRLHIRVPASAADEFSEHLSANGFQGNDDEDTPRSVWTEVIVATAANAAVWTGVGGIIVAYLRRNSGKVVRIEVDGKSVSIEGHSAKQSKRLAKDLIAMSRELTESDRTGGAADD